MWAAIAVLFVIALVAVSFAAGGAWLIIAVPLAILVLLPVAFLRLWPGRARVDGSRREGGHARPAVQRARETEDTIAPLDVP